MNKDNIKVQMVVKDQTINILRIEDIEYISLTDLARYADVDDRRYPIQNWMRNKDVISYLGLLESIHNENFKGGEFDTFKNEAGSNKFKISPQKWIKETNKGELYLLKNYNCKVKINGLDELASSPLIFKYMLLLII